MQEQILNATVQEGLPGERQRLRSALLADRDSLLTATRLRLARIARARGIPHEAVEDVVQETLFEAWRHLDRLHSPAGFQPWIDEICRNVCRRSDYRRELEAHRNVLFFEPETGPLFGKEHDTADWAATEEVDPLDRQDLVLLVDHALGVLPPAAREIVEMCYLRELPRAEMASRLKLSGSALDVRLHRARRHLHQILHGPLRQEAEALGLRLDEALAEGWQPTPIWCPRCGHQRLEGCFFMRDAPEGPNLHLRCPDCSPRYHQDTVHSMGMVRLGGLHAFRPAWKRTMQGLTDRILHALQPGQQRCLYCGRPTLVYVADDGEAYPDRFSVHMRCAYCDNTLDRSGNLPSVDQVVYWSNPRTRQFLLEHPRWQSTPAKAVTYEGTPALYFQIANRESNEQLTVLAHRQTLSILAID